MIDKHHPRRNQRTAPPGILAETVKSDDFDTRQSSRPASAHGNHSARIGSHRPESRAYGNFDHQQAIYTNRHGNLLVCQLEIPKAMQVVFLLSSKTRAMTWIQIEFQPWILQWLLLRLCHDQCHLALNEHCPLVCLIPFDPIWSSTGFPL